MNFKQYISETFVRPDSGSAKDVMKAFFQSVKFYTVSGLKKLFPDDPRIKEIETGLQHRIELINMQDDCIDAIKKFNAAKSEIANIDKKIEKFCVEMMHALVQSKQSDYHVMIVIRKLIKRLDERGGFEKVDIEPEAFTAIETKKKTDYLTADVMLQKIVEYLTNRGDEKLATDLQDFVARLKTATDPSVAQDYSWKSQAVSYPLSSVLKGTKASEQDITEGIKEFATQVLNWLKKAVDSITGDLKRRTENINKDKEALTNMIERL